ncbi:MAG: transposase [Halothiobacillaceae bacterium]|nr:transposase [Halothiobacillaceae bacterium]
MPRRARITVAGVPHHVVQRGHNRQATFFADEDYFAYRHSLKEGAQRYRCSIHAYALMTNHVHLLVTPTNEDGLSSLMRYLGSRYVQYVNFVYRRSGTLWEGRFKSSLVDQEQYLLTCYRYIELNPVRANMVAQPQDYRWSSYASHALGMQDDLIDDHPLYLALGNTEDTRNAAYRELFRYQLDDAVLTDIRDSLNKGLAVGADRFKDQIEETVARSVRPGQAGRKKARVAGGLSGEQVNLQFEKE